MLCLLLGSITKVKRCLFNHNTQRGVAANVVKKFSISTDLILYIFIFILRENERALQSVTFLTPARDEVIQLIWHEICNKMVLWILLSASFQSFNFWFVSFILFENFIHVWYMIMVMINVKWGREEIVKRKLQAHKQAHKVFDICANPIRLFNLQKNLYIGGFYQIFEFWQFIHNTVRVSNSLITSHSRETL